MEARGNERREGGKICMGKDKEEGERRKQDRRGRE